MALDNFWPKQTATQTLVVTITGKKKKKTTSIVRIII
jgi:hypothetical protein